MTIFEADFETTGPEDTREAARRLGQSLAGGGVIALFGDLGAGKTCFVQGLARGLGVETEGEVRSPTFVLRTDHPTRDGRLLIHVDAYRLGGEAEFLDLGIIDDIADPATILVVEWAERVRGALPDDLVEVHIDHLGPLSRRIRVRDRSGLLSPVRNEPPSTSPVEEASNGPE
jgi:tRNA threonylcarbamoyladenosine biosynthesis protein TsaE